MPDTDGGAPATLSLTIQGIKFETAPRFAEGHTLNAAEASVLNQTLVENLRNNFASTVKAAYVAAAKANGKVDSEGNPDPSQVTIDEIDVEALQSAFAEYEDAYEFGVRRTGTTRAPADPVAREALSIATDRVKAALKVRGYKLSGEDAMPAADIRKLAEQLIASDSAITDEAKRRVEAAKSVSVDLAALGLSE
jgi:hypothetical protein